MEMRNPQGDLIATATEYQPRSAARLVEILRAQDENPRSWQQEAADMIERGHVPQAINHTESLLDERNRLENSFGRGPFPDGLIRKRIAEIDAALPTAKSLK